MVTLSAGRCCLYTCDVSQGDKRFTLWSRNDIYVGKGEVGHEGKTFCPVPSHSVSLQVTCHRAWGVFYSLGSTSYYTESVLWLWLAAATAASQEPLLDGLLKDQQKSHLFQLVCPLSLAGHGRDLLLAFYMQKWGKQFTVSFLPSKIARGLRLWFIFRVSNSSKHRALSFHIWLELDKYASWKGSQQ